MKKINFLLVSLILIAAFFGNLTVVNAQTPTPQPGNTLQGDQVVIANTFRLAEGNTLNGSLGVIGSTAFIDKGSVVTKDVFVIGGTLSVAGSISGNIIAIGGAVKLDDSAVIYGDITTIGATVNRSPLAVVKGKIIEQTPTILDFNFNNPSGTPIPPINPVSPIERMLTIALQAFVMAAIAVIAALLLPEPIKRVANAFSEQPAIAGGVGLLVVIGFPIVLLILIITILLIPVALLAVFALVVILVYGWIALGYELGKKIGELFHTTWVAAVTAGIGTLVLTLVASVANLIPCVGWILSALIGLFGIGSVIMARFGSSKYRPIPRTSLPAQSVNSEVPPPDTGGSVS